MTETLLVLLAVSVLIGCGSYLLLRGANTPPPVQPTAAPQPLPVPKPVVVKKTIRQVIPERLTQQLEAIEQHLKKPVPVPPPLPAPVSPPAPPRVVAPATVRLRLVSAKGRALTTSPIVMDARLRRPVYRHRTKDGLISVFVVDHQGSDGVWEYRRVGVEREH